MNIPPSISYGVRYPVMRNEPQTGTSKSRAKPRSRKPSNRPNRNSGRDMKLIIPRGSDLHKFIMKLLEQFSKSPNQDKPEPNKGIITSSERATSKETTAALVAENAQSEQDKLMKLYSLSGGGFNEQVAAEWSRELGRPVTKENWEAVLRGKIEAQGQKVNTAYQILTAMQNILKNIHETIMASIRNMKLQ